MSSILTTPVSGPAAWTGSQLTTDSSWIYRLSDQALTELDDALKRVARANLPVHGIMREDFPLQSLAADLKEIGCELEQGRGFVQMKGLPVDRYTEQEIRSIYWGIGAHLGRAVSQNAKGDLIGDVRDEGVDIRDGKVRGYQTRLASPFHIDETDVVGLLCLQPARSGGLSCLVSSGAIYNALLKRYPWYVGVLYQDFYFDWRGENPEGTPPVYRWPVYEYFDGRLSCRYSRRMIEFGHQKIGSALSKIQTEAFDILDGLIEELRLDIDFEPGDMQFLNNYAILHSRSAFEDHAEAHRRRHLLRLWLTVPNGIKLSPAVLGERNVRDGVPVRAAVHV